MTLRLGPRGRQKTAGPGPSLCQPCLRVGLGLSGAAAPLAVTQRRAAGGRDILGGAKGEVAAVRSGASGSR